jgi:hypothetical protein
MKEDKKDFNDIKKIDYYKFQNRDEIKDNCEIEINGKKIGFFIFS